MKKIIKKTWEIYKDIFEMMFIIVIGLIATLIVASLLP
jgi:hypothetical protein